MLAHSPVSNDAAPTDASAAALLALTANAARESIMAESISVTLVMPMSSSCLASPRDIDQLQ